MTSRDHVAYQDGSLSFYVPELFDCGLYYNTSVPMLIKDVYDCIQKSQERCIKFYGNRISRLFWKNHPIERICVFGLVINHQWKELFKSKEEFMLISIDDCSSPRCMEPKILVCKCPKPVFLSCGISGDLSRNKVRVYGTTSFKYLELQVEHLEICNDLTLEIQHWQKALKMCHQLNIPWQIDAESVQEFYSRQNGNNEQDDFISKLEFHNAKDELLYSSPQDNEVEVTVLASSALVSTGTEYKRSLEIELNMNTSNIMLGSLENCSVEDYSNDKAHLASASFQLTDVAAYNSTQARNTLSRYLIRCGDCKISIVELFKMNPINDYIAKFAEFRFNQKNMASIKPVEQMKSEIFVDLLNKLNNCGLLIFVNQNLINTEPLRSLYDYCTNRLLALIKLKCFSGTIDHEHIKMKLNIPKLSRRAIIDIFKESIKDILEEYPSLLRNWWIEMNSGKFSIVHLEYQNN